MRRVQFSEPVREAVRDRYLVNFEERKKAMQAIVGIRKDWRESLDSTSYVRELRRDSRLERLGKK